MIKSFAKRMGQLEILEGGSAAQGVSMFLGGTTYGLGIYTPLHDSPPFGYTQEVTSHNVGPSLNDVRRDVSWWRVVRRARGFVGGGVVDVHTMREVARLRGVV